MAKRRRAHLTVEELEPRLVLSFTNFDQLLLQLVNDARANPQAYADRLTNGNVNQGLPPGTISAAAKQPLVFNQDLYEAAQGHTDDMLANDFFSHYYAPPGCNPANANCTDPGDRAEAAGYSWSAIGEDLAWRGSTSPIDQAQEVRLAHDQLFVSPGHREVMLDPIYEESGIATEVGAFREPFADGSSNPNGTLYQFTLMVTELYGQCCFSGADHGPFLTGAVINDADADQFYDVGEGVSGVTIQAVGPVTRSTASMSTGGYQLELPAGTYTVTASGNGISAQFQVTIASVNVKRDIIDDGLIHNFVNFNDANDIIVAGNIQSGSSTKEIILLNADTTVGVEALIAFDPLTAQEALRYNHPTGAFSGWMDASDRTLAGDVDMNGVTELVQFNRPATSGGALTDPAIRLVNITTGNPVTFSGIFSDGILNYSETATDPLDGNVKTYAEILADMVDPEDAVLVGRFSQSRNVAGSHLEALFFNKTTKDLDAVALRVIDLFTGQVTFSSLHDGNIFGGWIDPTDEAIASDTNNDGHDDFVVVNRTPNPELFRGTNKGFIGMVSIKKLPDNPAGPYRGFYRFFAWDIQGPGDPGNVFPGYDQIGDHTAGGFVLNNGLKPVILLVNGSSTNQAAYAVLEPKPIVQGQPHTFQLITTIMHANVPAGSFDADDTHFMADLTGDGMDEVIAYSKASGGNHLRVFHSLTHSDPNAQYPQLINEVPPAGGGGSAGWSASREESVVRGPSSVGPQLNFVATNHGPLTTDDDQWATGDVSRRLVVPKEAVDALFETEDMLDWLWIV